MHLQEIGLFDLDLGVKNTGNVAQYPLHYLNYAPVKFEVLRQTVMEEMHLPKNTLFDL